MNAKPDSCEPARLRLLAEDQLPPNELTELEKHLEGCLQCRLVLDDLVDADGLVATVRQRLETGIFDCLDPAAEREEALPFLTPSDWPDSLGRLGTYEIKGILGRGGMGVVLKALDPVLNRYVAIKVMAAGLAACAASRQRFLREARAAAAVVHEHVVAVYAVEETAGLPYLVMEYVPGLSLQERIDRDGSSSITEILRIGMQTAAGLAAAHMQGLVHRDVKPANILLENSVERVRLTDFGLARAVADAGMTHSGVIAGTPHYMAPEQANGQITDHRADLFSLGSTLYAACAGCPPFCADSPLAVLRRVCDDPPRPIHEINPEVPAWLELLIARLMAKNPAERFQTASEVASLLGGCLAHVQQPLLFPLPDALKPVETHPVPMRSTRLTSPASMVVTLVLLILGTAALIIPAQKPKHASAPVAAAPSQVEPPSIPHIREPEQDEIQLLLERAQSQVWSLQGEVLRHDSQREIDWLTVRSVDLSSRSQALEREILSGRSSLHETNGFVSTPNPHDRR